MHKKLFPRHSGWGAVQQRRRHCQSQCTGLLKLTTFLCLNFFPNFFSPGYSGGCSLQSLKISTQMVQSCWRPYIHPTGFASPLQSHTKSSLASLARFWIWKGNNMLFFTPLLFWLQVLSAIMGISMSSVLATGILWSEKYTQKSKRKEATIERLQ